MTFALEKNKEYLFRSTALYFLVLFLGFLFWSTLVRIEGAIVVQAVTRFGPIDHVGQSTSNSIVVDVFKQDGDSVAEGEIIALLASSDIDLALESLQLDVARLALELARMEASLDGRRDFWVREDLSELVDAVPNISDLYEAERAVLHDFLEVRSRLEATFAAEVAALNGRQEFLLLQMENASEQLALAEQEVARLNALMAEGLSRVSDVIAAELRLLSTQAALNELVRNVEEVEIEMQRLAESYLLEVTDSEHEIRIGMASLEVELTFALRQLSQVVESSSRLSMLAPFDGTLRIERSIFPGRVLVEGDVVYSVVAASRDVLLEAYIPLSVASDIAVGQPTFIDFPQTADLTGRRIQGSVFSVSPDALNFRDQGLEVRVFVTVNNTDDEEEIRYLAPSGSLATVHFRTRDYSPFEFVIEPLIDFVDSIFLAA